MQSRLVKLVTTQSNASLIVYCSFVLLPVTKNTFLSIYEQHLKVKNDTKANAITIVEITSNRQYSNQYRSLAAVRKCGAPSCRITYSIQNIALSMIDIGLSRMMADALTTASLNLQNSTRLLLDQPQTGQNKWRVISFTLVYL